MYKPPTSKSLPWLPRVNLVSCWLPISEHRGLLAPLVGIFCVARKVLFVLKEVDGVC